MSEQMMEAKPSPPPRRTVRDLLLRPAGWVSALYNAADRLTQKLARAAAYRLPWQLLSIVLAMVGSLLIWIGPKPAMLMVIPFNGLDCWDPMLGKWLGLNCAAAPKLAGLGWYRIAAYAAAWFGWLMVLFGLVWLVARVFVSLSSRIVMSDLERVERGIAREILIMGLSHLENPDKAVEEAREWSKDPAAYAGPAAAWREKAGSSARAVAAGWQQGARMVHAHLAGDKLATIYVLPSFESEGSLPRFRTYLETLFGRPLDVRPVTAEDGTPFRDPHEQGPRGQSYENYTYLRDGLRRAVVLARENVGREKRRRLRDSEICIDATAGFKLFSIAAAVAAFDRNVLLGYVVTGGGPNVEEGVVKLYDPRIDFLPAVTRRVSGSMSQPA